uniref:Acetylcholine receptor subunit alpha-like 1 n=1 Tax=Caligus rogercresseyi TaxID=217165 RepID=C1BRL1_CALRO|nr:Acetylcholine receptor subunit alpha-like 1 precursor [Caligus rogercresseyi]|eukprot:TRINITY_DN376_c0_g1_i1.p1 TRINITY_DN376_c0_g1~~TRINITY_DN376_c0_g1_i1.p1  ORF type:complete len:240 (+),score=50.40 TRINITY_DN376_c0_g1_i1:59-778(+)
MRGSVLLSFLFVGISFGSPQGELYKSLFENYNPSVHPGTPQSIGPVGFSIVPQCMSLSLDGQLDGHIWARISWMDERLMWNPEDHDGIKLLRIPIEKLWSPDITLYTKRNENDFYGKFNAIVYNTGKVLYVPDTHVKADCSGLNTTDIWAVNECKLTYGSWTYDHQLMELKESKRITDADEITAYCPLQTVDVLHELKIKKYSCCEEPYSHIEYKILLQRRYLMTDKGPVYNPYLPHDD